ncbi:MAG: SDR family oxidoreductase [Drouetiella hepatica Uher 2000/2452]|jgi:NAD(P)-dependent dehydrogenase (short-subunit alcohol dehydrogenase family)|uniref:SDR family oxidoreductase n=1 Tax=Drouetiella hepatica Uher 2000/2452 TaxID=904376 RepID=A0A951ULH0_9CYAN|nr:SDR family oxidoreductase [Drouetiella hepatica Uher 2000/2452]
MQLENQNVVIIGGSSGIGFETAQWAKKQGAIVTITGRNLIKLEQAAKELGNVTIAIVDIAQESSVQQLMEAFDHVDHLVVLGASLASGTVVGTPLEQLARPIDERIWGAVYAVRHAAPKMSGGSITLMSGLFSSRPIAGMSIVAAAVGGIEAMTRSLALELAPIRVNAIAPGYIDTPLLQAAFADQYEGVVKAQAATLPTQRIGTASEAAQSILFLMTSGFITGEVLHLDGGGRYV